MDIILKQDLDNLGYADEIVKVRPGYARNFLIPNGLAIIANEENRKVLAETMKQRAHKAQKIKGGAEEQAKKLEAMVIKIGAKVGESGKIYGSVNALQLADALSKLGVEVDRKKIHLDSEHIKTLGTYSAVVNLHKDVKAKVNFEVVAE
ncbi:MAG TPA: 50S ribosomal protein L9 [Bacteroidia bacterium]|jgi:large subunit ribosomal protein L9|nr:50S ribosomal protein L9 [Bacteroidota bacterium]MBP9790205.1 50S ribosomal protein L9 [Bacteroidia bacterium]MBK7430620.1 50S ribosomal protein L9 [Bacteroidota bacterium]MBK8585237.1 50S ribosomal protein L9 [Bacteroidota bacterium]MBP9922901.1 50S ribosomal protein L9 [Bacteroidia bacterium]